MTNSTRPNHDTVTHSSSLNAFCSYKVAHTTKATLTSESKSEHRNCV